MSKERERERRIKATGKWFQRSSEGKILWINHVFPVLLILGFVLYLYNL